MTFAPDDANAEWLAWLCERLYAEPFWGTLEIRVESSRIVMVAERETFKAPPTRLPKT